MRRCSFIADSDDATILDGGNQLFPGSRYQFCVGSEETMIKAIVLSRYGRILYAGLGGLADLCDGETDRASTGRDMVDGDRQDNPSGNEVQLHKADGRSVAMGAKITSGTRRRNSKSEDRNDRRASSSYDLYSPAS